MAVDEVHRTAFLCEQQAHLQTTLAGRSGCGSREKESDGNVHKQRTSWQRRVRIGSSLDSTCLLRISTHRHIVTDLPHTSERSKTTPTDDPRLSDRSSL